MKFGKKFGAVLLVLSVILMMGAAAADPASPPEPPAPSQASGNNYEPVPVFKTCNQGYNAATDTVEYCDKPYRQTKTKTIYFCDEDGDSNYDSGEVKGSWSNPTPSCDPGETYSKLKDMQKQYLTCGKKDATKISDVNKTTSVSSNWFCPSTKGLSLRHAPGNLDPGVSISSSGYKNITSMERYAGNNVSFDLLAAIPACVNRIPMINLNVQLNDDYHGEVAEKTGIYASHMTLYYGPTGSSGELKELQLPEQKAFRRQYDVEVNTKAYRMWAWRQRFAGAVKEVVSRKNLQLPRNVDVKNIAQNYRDQGKSVGDLWLSSDFLYGAEAGNPQTRTNIITRTINSTCAQDVTKITERDFDDPQDFVNYVKGHESQVIDWLGKKGSNYCDIGTNETLVDIRSVEPTKAKRSKEKTLKGRIKLSELGNTTEQVTAGFDVKYMEAKFRNSSYQMEKVTSSQDFMKFYNQDPQAAKDALRDNRSYWVVYGPSIQGLKVTDLSDFQISGPDRIQFDVEYMEPVDAQSFSGMSDREVQNRLDKHVLGSDNSFVGTIKPVGRFSGKMLTPWQWGNKGGVLSHKYISGNRGRLTMETVDIVERNSVFIYTTYTKKEAAKRSWNWRALQGISMTELAKCMYNWDACMSNDRSLSSRPWTGSEVYDAGYGPWEMTNTFNWSETAAENRAGNLSQDIQATNVYNHSVSIEFDKYYDGARGTVSGQMTPINVYRPCSSSESWRSQNSEFYPDYQFICPDSTDSNQGTVKKSEVYRCARSPAQHPAEFAAENRSVKMNGNWYVCLEKGSAQWFKDLGDPNVSVQKEGTAGSQYAEVACLDTVKLDSSSSEEEVYCDASSKRMKIYEPGNQPSSCPTDFSEYDVKASRKEINSHKYVCAAAKDLVGNKDFSNSLVEFGEEAESENVVATLEKETSRVIVPVDETTGIRFRVENNAPNKRKIRIEIGGSVNASFTNGGDEITETMPPGESENFIIKVTPTSSGTKDLTVEMKDQTKGYKVTESTVVQATTKTGALNPQDSRSVPGIELIHILFLIGISTLFISVKGLKTWR
ncbi:MAG: hypothetical protein ABEJ93_03750 [Candidatus Nanohalobium sp.]